MSAHRVYFKISRPLDKVLMTNDSPEISPSSIYGLHIDSKNNEDLTCTSFPLTTDVSIAFNISNNHTLVSSLPIAMIPSMDIGLDGGIVLDPDYPTMEPTSGGSCKVFGNIFGVPFLAKHGACIYRQITSLELLS